jgi:hypothetical protein
MSGGTSDPSEENPYVSPPVEAQLAQTSQVSPSGEQGDGTGGVIPYKNPPALFAYYTGLFSFIPIIGFFLAVPAFVLGIMGLRARKRNPAIKGSIHAWIGIIMGGFFTIVWGLAIASIFWAILGNAP